MPEDSPQAPWGEFVPEAEFEKATIQISVSPLSTLFMFLVEAASDRPLWQGPAPWQHAVRSQVTARDLETFAPLADPRTSAWPNVLTSDPLEPGFVAFDGQLEAIFEADPDAFLELVDHGWGERPLDSWLEVRRDPARWLRSYCAALQRGWKGIEPLWTRATGLLDREFERVGSALARGAGLELVDALHPRSAIIDGRWQLPNPMSEPRPFKLANRFLLRPLIVDGGCIVGDDDAGSLTELSYPLADAWRTIDGDHPPPASLEALLGQQRTRILRGLDRPANATQIAEILFAVPSAATHHLRTLEAAGLVTRTRSGRGVTVERTARGTGLLALYDRP